MPFANFKVPAGTLTAEQKEQIVHRTTDLYAEIYGERARPNTMVLIEEVADGRLGHRRQRPHPNHAQHARHLTLLAAPARAGRLRNRPC